MPFSKYNPMVERGDSQNLVVEYILQFQKLICTTALKFKTEMLIWCHLCHRKLVIFPTRNFKSCCVNISGWIDSTLSKWINNLITFLDGLPL